MKSKLLVHYLTYSLLLIVFASIQSCNMKNKQDNHDVHWEKIGPGGGGAIFIPTFAYNSAENFLLRCDMTGTYLTRDGGASYQQINFAGGVSSFAFDPIDSSNIYIGSAFLNRSVDGGKTWDMIFPPKEDIVREIYFGDHADDSGKTWARETLQEPISFIYTNKETLKDDVYIFTASSVYVFNKSSLIITRKNLPEIMSPAFSFTGGMEANSDKVLLYALHHDPNEDILGEFGHSEVWTSEDLGDSWKRILHPAITNDIAGIKPSYSMISCSEFDASNAYLICNRYEEKTKNKGMIYWYGAIKTGDSGTNWEWVWKGGGGSGQYAVKDGIGVANLEDAWAEEAFGGEYIRLMDVGIAPADGNIATQKQRYWR